MATFPTLSVRVAFVSNPYDASLTFTEIGPASGLGPGAAGWVRKVTTKRGRERLLRSQSQFQAGTMMAELDNRDRRFDPTNTAGPYYPNVQPEKVIQIGATWASTFYPIWTGYIDDWPQIWPGMQEANVPLPATDFFKAAALARLLSAGYQKTVLADGPSAYWRLGDVAGSTVAKDSSGNGWNGTPNSSVIFGNTGAMPANVGTAASFPLASSGTPPAPSGTIAFPGGILPANPGPSATGLSVEAWVNVPATVTNAELVGINTNAFYSFTLQIAAGKPVFTLGLTITGPNVINDGNWHHVVATMPIGVTGTGFLYVDGIQVASTAGFGGGEGGVSGPGAIEFGPLIATLDAGVELQEVALYATQLSGAQVLNHYQHGGWPSEFTGQVVNRILDTIGFPSGQRSVDTGRTLCAVDHQDETQTKVLDQLQKLEQTEQGQLFVAANGNIAFQDRYHRYESPHYTSVATLGDGGAGFPTEIDYSMGGVVLNFDRMELFNDVPVTRRGGKLQEVTNQASVSEFTNRTMTGLSDLLMATDADALYCAQWVVADTAYPQYRIGQLIMDPIAVPALWPIVLGSDIGTVVTVNKHNIPGGGSPVPISIVCRVEGIEHQIDPPHSWKVTWHVSLVGTLPWFILNDPVLGLLDHGNRWGW